MQTREKSVLCVTLMVYHKWCEVVYMSINVIFLNFNIFMNLSPH